MGIIVGPRTAGPGGDSLLPSWPRRDAARRPSSTIADTRKRYAQRHADADAVDLLKELMHHVAVATTMGCYSVGLERKQQASRSVGSLVSRGFRYSR